jgi:hypothetical protein
MPGSLVMFLLPYLLLAAYVATGFVLLSAQLGLAESKKKLVPVRIRSRLP